MKKATNQLRNLAIAAPLLAAALLIAWRLLNPGLAPFILDEPMLQNSLDLRIAEHRMPLLGLFGSYGLRYGPTAMWFYLPLRLFTANEKAIVLWHAFSFVAAFAFYFAAVRRAVGIRGGAWSLLLAATSPLLFFYSRLAWDNTLFTLFSALIAHELVRVHARPRTRRFALLGLWCGLAVNLHPMALPMVMSALLTAAPAARPWERGVKTLAAALLPILLLLVVYAAGLMWFHDEWSQPRAGIHAPGGSAWVSFLGSLSGLMQYFTPSALTSLIGGDEGALSARLPASLRWLTGEAGSWLSGVAGWAMLLPLAARRRFPPLTAFALLSVTFTIAFYAIVRPDPLFPHYFTPYWWIGFYGLAMAIERAQPSVRAALEATTSALALTNVIFIGAMITFLGRNEGMRGLSYGTAMRETHRITAQLCSVMTGGSAVLHLDKVTSVASPSIAYFAAHLEECRDRRVLFYPNVSPVSSTSHFELRYGNGGPEDASLVLTRIPAPLPSR